MLIFVFNWVSISFKNLLKIFNLFFIYFFNLYRFISFFNQNTAKNKVQELKSGNFVNSIGFLHGKSPDPLVRRHYFKRALRRAHCTEIDFALSFGAVLVKMIDWSKIESRDFFGITLGQENSQKLYLFPKSCYKLTE